MYLARMGIQVWKTMVHATRKQNDVQNRGAISKRERSVWLLIRFSFGKGLTLSSWPVSKSGAEAKAYISYYGTRSVSEVYRKNSLDFLFFNIHLVVFRTIATSDVMVRLFQRACSEKRRWSSARILACPEGKNILVTAEKVVPSGRCWNV